jgi:nucleotide-binding universal stress UspA family protein
MPGGINSSAWRAGGTRGTDEEEGMSTFPAKILLATDGSEDSSIAGRAAVEIANDTGAELHVVHVGESHPVHPPPTAGGPPMPVPSKDEIRQVAQGVLDHQVKEIRESGGKVEEAHLRTGRPTEEILRLSEEMVAGLIVVGNQGLSGRFSRMKRFVMGSVSESVTRYARCSVMVVRKDLYDRPPT